MTTQLLPALALLSATFLAGCSTTPPADTTPLHIDDLARRPVIGRLGVPLGTVVNLQGVITSQRELRIKGSDYLLRVTHVAGQPLPTPQVMHFSVPFGGAPLAKDAFDLYKLKRHEEVTKLDSNQIAQLERGYLGQTVSIAAYETGSFSGIPLTLPSDVPSWQDRNFGLSTRLVILAERP